MSTYLPTLAYIAQSKTIKSFLSHFCTVLCSLGHIFLISLSRFCNDLHFAYYQCICIFRLRKVTLKKCNKFRSKRLHCAGVTCLKQLLPYSISESHQLFRKQICARREAALCFFFLLANQLMMRN